MQIRFTYYKPQVLVPLIVILWACSSWLLSLTNNELIRGVAPTTIVITLLSIYDRWLWKLPLLRLMNTIPNLNGVYHGNIEYNFNGRDDTKACTLRIVQTCSTIKVTATFNKDAENETQSVSSEAFIVTDSSGEHQLHFYYRNKGSCKAGDTLEQHDGINIMDIIICEGMVKLDGYYFTNRSPQTKGCMKVVKDSKGV